MNVPFTDGRERFDDAKARWLREMRECVVGGDEEITHADADEILCEALRMLGHGDLVDEWERVPKWYA